MENKDESNNSSNVANSIQIDNQPQQSYMAQNTSADPLKSNEEILNIIIKSESTFIK